MTPPVSVAVIGVGSFGRRHLEAYARQPGVEIVAVADSDEQRAAAAAARWGVPRWFADGAELIGACLPAAVSVATPAQHHAALTITALENGCSVLLEKPVAMSGAEVDAIAAAADASPAFVVPAHILRFGAPHIAMRTHVRAGAVGSVIGICARRDRDRSHAVLHPDIDPTLMTMVHDIDLCMWVTGARALRVSAQGRAWGGGGHPMLVWAQIEADDGSVWSLRTSWVVPDGSGPSDRFEVYGTEGAAVLDLDPTVTVFGSPVDLANGGSFGDPLAGTLDVEIGHFCECVRNRLPSDVVTLAEAGHGIRTAEAIIASAANAGELTAVIP